MYLIDGSNLAGYLYDDPQERKGVFQQVMNWARNRKNRVVLFFDGSPDSNFPREKASFGNVEVRLAFPASADAAILKETKLDPRNRTIVTGDRALADKIKSLKGKIVPVRDFIKRLSP